MYIDRYWEIVFSFWKTSSKESRLTKCSSRIQVNTANLRSGKILIKTEHQEKV